MLRLPVLKPHIPGSTGGDQELNPLAVLAVVLMCLLVVTPIAVVQWRQGDKTLAVLVLATPLVGIGLWVLAVAAGS